MIALRIVTPKGNYASLNVKSIHIKSVEGEMTILSNHIPIFASIVPCELVLECEDGNKNEYALSGGFFHFENNEALLLTDAIEGKGEIDLERAKKAYERARKRLEKKDSNTDMKRAELALQRAIIRIHVSEN
ncbi:MAG: ATP synthase F1 subunit epsilon [Floccifex porci]|uniref:ATP synthase epsilon chain n=1 Tax=Floccifex porci TaxID=2606629 RepID=A0A7X2T389_9FIRM|nr:ATP synthase F1 subunit epsilon [Floccifex porci]MCI7801789.1 ATP synthase F1 subunit epsilon [Erysipelotrichaceae bacterium]MDD7467321.1 ATP synthase F1 subunit epsilon [Floccifex porci]MDO4479525.1 ATP synthase F1 subunit epsilon [Erysipelotrichaceae bacterium]MDY4796739.1 ATP synthase F1 subunit epsilon [Floccifex porci]MSS01175.1 ATP synthase F1 subunit epsilon [Floccifex porci]